MILGGCFPALTFKRMYSIQTAEVVAATCRHLGKYVVHFLYHEKPDGLDKTKK